MLRIRSERYAGQTVIVGSDVLEFGSDGYCIGVVGREGGAVQLPTPEPVTEEHVEVLRQLPYYVVEEVPETEPQAAPMTRAQLAEMAARLGIRVTTRTTRQQLLEALRDAGAQC
jgi:hypothetical protein